LLFPEASFQTLPLILLHLFHKVKPSVTIWNGIVVVPVVLVVEVLVVEVLVVVEPDVVVVVGPPVVVLVVDVLVDVI
jgi:hypothetical protein